MLRLEGKTAIIVGAGQSPGEGIGNGRATALRFAQEGARVMAVDRDLASAEDTAYMIRKEGGECLTFEADVTKEVTLADMVAAAQRQWGRIDIMHYNVGVSVSAGDTRLDKFTEDIFDRINAINLRGAIMACKHVLRVMREQRSGSITMLASTAAIENNPHVAYKISKAGMVAFTKQIARENAEVGIRANVILLGFVDTPAAIGARVQQSSKGRTREQFMAVREAYIPLRHKMGTAWDCANAALFLNSDEANFITGLEMIVDGGGCL
jgi:NAD(P)-dependent dehydrogenase (short-subunit alcohol dehydrogenase family)